MFSIYYLLFWNSSEKQLKSKLWANESLHHVMWYNEFLAFFCVNEIQQIIIALVCVNLCIRQKKNERGLNQKYVCKSEITKYIWKTLQ